MSVVEFMSCGLVTFFGHQFLQELEFFSVIIDHRYPDLKLRFEAHQCGVRSLYECAISEPRNYTITNTKTRTQQPINPYNFKTPLTDWLLDRSLFYTVHEILN